MRPEDYPEGVQYAWCAHQAFRRLGFKADDIWLIIAKAGDDNEQLHAFMTLKTQGKEIHVDCGRADEKTFPELWKSFCKAFNENKFREKALRKVFDASNFTTHTAQFVMLLLNRGFQIPSANRNMN